MAATELESIVARLKANTSDMVRGFDAVATKAEATAMRVSKSFQAAGQRIQNIGKQLSIAITAPIVAYTGFSIKAASDVQELQNLIQVTFGDMTDDIRTWADETAAIVNRSSDSMLKAAGDFAAFLKPLGIAKEQIVPMSKALSQLTTDVSSFRNIAEEDVFVRLFSGLAGETEAVRRLGVDIGQTAMETELLRMGFKGNAAEASQAQKVLARYNLIVQQTRDAQGDAARTADSFENSTRGLAAVMRDIQISIGERLLPRATELTRKMSELGRRFLALPDEAQGTILMGAAIAAGLGPGLIALGTLIRILGFAGQGLTQFAGITLRTFALVARAPIAFAGALFTIPGAFAAIVASVYLFQNTVFAVFQSIADFARALAAPIAEPIRIAFQFVKDIALDVQQFFAKVLNAIINQFNRFVESIEWLTGKSLKNLVMDPINIAGEAIAEFVNDLPEFNFKRIKDAANEDLNNIKDKFRTIVNEIKSLMPQLPELDLEDALHVEETNMELDELQARFDELFKGFDSFGESSSTTLDDSIDKAKELSDELRRAFVGRMSEIKDLGDAMSAVIDRLKAQILEIIFFGQSGQSGLFGGIFSQIGNFVSGIFGGGKATGGPVNRNTPYIVGEKGPEMFVPSTSGKIMDAGQTSRMGGNTVNVYQTYQFPADNNEITERMVMIGSVMRDQAIAVFQNAGKNAGF